MEIQWADVLFWRQQNQPSSQFQKIKIDTNRRNGKRNESRYIGKKFSNRNPCSEMHLKNAKMQMEQDSNNSIFCCFQCWIQSGTMRINELQVILTGSSLTGEMDTSSFRRLRLRDQVLFEGSGSPSLTNWVNRFNSVIHGNPKRKQCRNRRNPSQIRKLSVPNILVH